MRKVLAFISIFSFIVNQTNYAQKSNFEYLTTDPDGLSQSVVRDINQDHTGNLWIATHDGLNCYNGKEFIRYYEEDGLPTHEIEGVIEVNNDEFLIATRMGLAFIKDKKVIPYKNGFVKNHNEFEKIFYEKSIYNLIKGISNKIYFSSGNELYVIENSLIKEIDLPLDENNSIEIYCLREFNNDLFIGTNQGLIKLSENGNTVYKNSDGLTSDSINCLTQFNNDLLIGTGYGIATLSDNKIHHDENFKDVNNKTITDIELKEERVVVATINSSKGEIYIYNVNGFSYQYYDYNFFGQKINDVLIDKEDNIWVGTTGNGIVKYRENPFITYDHQFRLKGTIWSVLRDSNETIWAGSSDGLFIKEKDADHFSKYLLKYVVKDNLITSNSIHAIMEDRNKRMWFCIPKSGIVIYENGEYKKLNLNSNQLLSQGFKYEIIEEILNANNRARSALLDKNGNIWIGTYSGLLVFSEDLHVIDFYNKEKGLKGNIVQSIYEDLSGNIWIGTSSGLSVLKGGRLFDVPELDDFNHSFKSIFSIKGDSLGNIYIGTDHGLYLLHTNKGNIQKAKYFDGSKGLTNSVIYTMQFDNMNNLYLGTTLGIDKITPESIKQEQIVAKHYGPNEGFLGVECNTNSSCKDIDGNLWFGSIGGCLSKFRPNYDLINQNPPFLSINDIRLNYDRVSLWKLKSGTSKDILNEQAPVFYYDQNHLTFDFSGTTMINHDKITYSYWLEGLDGDWGPKNKFNSVTYPNLLPGSYVFHLRVYNSDGVSSKILNYSFTISPPFWKTTWFYLLVFVTLVFTIITIIKIRERQLKRINIILEKKVDKRTFELKEEKIKVEKQHNEITKSINYARRIQYSILPEEDLLTDFFKEHFVLYQPKDIVGGDFFWYRCFGDISVIATVDCTGHGVPGGFMSMMGSLLLDKIIQIDNLNTSKILQDLHKEITRVLNQKSGGEIQDGMDIAICIIDKEKRKLHFSGARNGIMILSEEKLNYFDADIFSVGGSYSNKSKLLNRDFKTHSIDLKSNDWVFMYTDGYYDQLGGKEINSMGADLFKNTLKESLGAKASKVEFLQSKFNAWKGEYPQIDDVLVLGFKI